MMGGNSSTGNVSGESGVAGSTFGTNTTTESVPENSTDILIAPQVTVIEENQETETNIYKPAVTIHMEDTTILTPEKLQMAKEQNFDLLLAMGGHATWRIDIDSVNTENLTEVDMGVTLGTENVPREVIAAILDGNKYLEFTLAHDGLFGFDPVLSITLNPENSGRYANLFYYDPEQQKLEFICDSIIDERGIAAFGMEHASSYIIIVSDHSMSGALAEDEATGFAVRWILIGVFVFMIIVIIGYAVFFYSKKRRGMDDEDIEEDEDIEDDEGGLEEEGYLDDDDKPEEIEVEEIKDVEDEEPENGESESEEKYDEEPVDEEADEDDWIEDKDWHEPEVPKTNSIDRFADDHSEDDWIEDDEWDSGNDWMDDAEWEQKNKNSKS